MPELTCFVSGTATDCGKTWVVERLSALLIETGVVVRARKPVQSFGPDDAETDASRLASATRDEGGRVTSLSMSFPLPLAPPIAARRLGRPQPTLRRLIESIDRPDCELLLIEGVGGARSPVALDGDSSDLARLLEVDLVIVVSHAGLGAINDVRGALQAHVGAKCLVFLNRFDGSQVSHEENLKWLIERDHATVFTTIEDLVAHLLSILDTHRTPEPMEV